MSDEAAREVPPPGAAAAEEGRAETARDAAAKNASDAGGAKGNAPGPAGEGGTGKPERAKADDKLDKLSKPGTKASPGEKNSVVEPATPQKPTEPQRDKAVETKPGKGGDQKPEKATEAKPEKAAEPATEKAAEPAKRQEIRIRVFGRTDVGQVREHNEDNFIVADLTKASRGLMEADRTQVVGDRGALLGVCDGMGGAAAGEVASQLAVDIIFQKMASGDRPENHDDLASRLVQSIEAAGLRIFSEAKLDRTRRGMGTTSTIAALLDDHLFLGQVGDSRGYVLRGDRLVQVTRDQSLVNQLIEAGQLTEEEAETFEHNNIILQALGTSDTVQVDLTFVPLRRGDTLLLCSDGLSGMVRNEEIREVLRSIGDPLEACKVLTDRANQAGGHDNITVVVAKFEGEGLLEQRVEDVDNLRYQKYQLPEPPMSPSPAAEPSRRIKELDQSKVSTRPAFSKSARGSSGSPDIEVAEHDGPLDDLDDEDSDGRAHLSGRGDEPILIPTEGAPSWLVTMMIVSAILCVSIAGYYLLR
jgi:protein phosphatase